MMLLLNVENKYFSDKFVVISSGIIVGKVIAAAAWNTSCVIYS